MLHLQGIRGRWESGEEIYTPSVNINRWVIQCHQIMWWRTEKSAQCVQLKEFHQIKNVLISKPMGERLGRIFYWEQLNLWRYNWKSTISGCWPLRIGNKFDGGLCTWSHVFHAPIVIAKREINSKIMATIQIKLMQLTLLMLAANRLICICTEIPYQTVRLYIER